ncbi:MAG: RHS repeat-associated core domain-containing protein [Lachnospiraceae bacterium]|nr:RHS repeat-associated core domain-containing protein [Lachnospiraceae bacterium]
MAEANPLRYRGYYYDRETEFYYLNSRYYDPKTGRFINADSYVSTGQGIMGYNMFAYCGNNPVNRSDTEGRLWETFLDLLSLGASLIDVWNNPKDGWAWAGLGGDAVDLIPFVTGVGEGTKALGAINKMDNARDAAKVVKSGSNAGSGVKKVPNPYGKKGCQAHRDTIASIQPSRTGGAMNYEKGFVTPKGSKSCRYADAVEIADGNIVAIHQVGKVNKNGTPVIRESRAIEDIMNSSDYNGAPIYFWPYSSDSGPIIYDF